ncbi:hypothetical protein TKK_0005060 [Trichogramma kaykai]|uniref:F-box domain-containing protein n=1 Tax=Trichogramma kaykai TaxID=54128 RepID=A0ABD2XJE5_9HYME
MEIISKNNKEDQQKLNGDSYLHKDITTFSSNQERVDLTRTDNIIDTMFQTVAAVPADILNKFSFINDKSSSETDDFYGFETSEYKQYDISKTTLKRLIEQEEADIFQISKRRKTTNLWKGLKNADSFSEEIDENISEPGSPKTVPEANFSDSTANDFSSKSEKCNNTSMHSTKTRTKRSFRAASPITTTRQKVSIDITNPLYREPFKYGWKRELVYRAGSSDNQSKRMADIYYYTPEGKKVRSFREVTETLTTSELTIENFTFFKEPLGVNDPAKEIIRDAKKGKEAHVPTKPYQKIPKKSIDTPPIQNDTPKKSSVKSTPPAIPVKTPSKNAKVASKLKVKISSKKVTPSKESKSPMTSTDNTVDTKVAQTSQWTNASNNKEIVDKNHAMKSKKIIKIKEQEPCSIRCSSSIGLIPTLQCVKCLCLYHPKCIQKPSTNSKFTCKNCQLVTDESFRESSSAETSLLYKELGDRKKQVLKKKESLEMVPKIKESLISFENYNDFNNDNTSRENKLSKISTSEFKCNDNLNLRPIQNIASIKGKKFIVVSNRPVTSLRSSPINLNRYSNEISKTNISDDEVHYSLNGNVNSINTVEIKPKTDELLLSLNEVGPYTLTSSNFDSKIIRNTNVLPSSDERKKSNQIEADNKQNFMVSVCAGYHALSRIFQYLKVQELLRAGRVCRMWRDLAAHPSLWKTVRMKNSQVTDWDGFAEALKSRGTQYLDLRKMLIAGDAADSVWQKFVNIIPKITSLLKLELCRCPAMVVEEVMKNCPQLKILNALSIKCESINIKCVSELKNCTELRLKGLNAMTLDGDLSSLVNLTQLTHLSLTSIKELGSKKIKMVESLYNLESLELGECCDFPENFGTDVLVKLQSLNRLRLEKGQGSCCTFDILEGISQLKNLTQLELVNFDVKNGFDRHLARCKNIKRFLIIPTYVSQSATSNNMILKGVTELSNNLTHFVWGVTQELLKVTELFVDQCNQMNKHVSGDSIPVLKPVPYMNLIQDLVNDKNQLKEEQQLNSSNPQVEILPLPHLQKLLLTALPKTRVKILKIPFHATWRQSITDSTTQ